MRAARLAALAVALAPLPASATTPDIARLDTLLEAAHFSGVALAGQGDGIVWSRALGTTPAGVPHDPARPWRLASVTKQLTALVVMQEVAAGRLDLDAPLARLWPEWPGAYRITLTPRMLLRHESGLADPAESRPDATGMPEFYHRAGAAADPVVSATGFCAATPRAAPANGYHYDNCDYIVLGALLERLTGQSFATLLQTRIGEPLAVRTLGLFRFDAPAPSPPDGGVVAGRREPAVNFGSYGAAGSAYMSPLDLWAFDRALMEYRLLDRVATAQMWAGDPALGYAAFGSWSFAIRLPGCPDPVSLIERRGQIGGIQIRNFLAPVSHSALLLFTDDGDFTFGEVGEARGFAYGMLAAALCPAAG